MSGADEKRMRDALRERAHRDSCACPICSTPRPEATVPPTPRPVQSVPRMRFAECDVDAIAAIRDQLPLPHGVADVLTSAGMVRARIPLTEFGL